jgi:hypothetical protein
MESLSHITIHSSTVIHEYHFTALQSVENLVNGQHSPNKYKMTQERVSLRAIISSSVRADISKQTLRASKGKICIAPEGEDHALQFVSLKAFGE